MDNKQVELNQQSQDVIDIVTNDSKAYGGMVAHLKKYKDGGRWSTLCEGMKLTINPCLSRLGCNNLKLLTTNGYTYQKDKTGRVDHLDHLVNGLLHYYSEEVFGYKFTQWCGINDAPLSSKDAYQDNATKYVKEITTKKETETMKSIIKIKNKILVNGVDVADMTDDTIFDQIATSEAEITRLEAIKAKPKKLTTRIKEIQDGIAGLVKIVDERK